MNHLFYSLISLAIALFFLTLGIMCVMLPWSPIVRSDLIQFILEDSIAICLFGFGFVIVGLAVIVNIAFSAKHSYYQLRSGPQSISIDEAIIQEYLNTYWKNLFPQSTIPNRLTIKKNKIHLVANLPYIPLPEQKRFLEKVKIDLSELFTATLGYQDTFYLSASFQPEQKNKNSQVMRNSLR
jgi:hypothetical protein